MEVKQKKQTVVFDTDEAPRPNVTAESISKLRPAFKEGGVVTAGNSSGINDAAAALIVMSEEKAKELGVKPMATWVAGELAGVEPRIMGIRTGCSNPQGNEESRLRNRRLRPD